mgnify:CR=1 FL=1
MNIPIGSKFSALSAEERDQVFKELREPFDPEDIDWKPQSVKGDKAVALAFADPRVYIDRLNTVVGIGNWNRKFEFIVTPWVKVIKGKAPWGSPEGTPVPPDKVLNGNKVMCISTVSVLGIEQASTGESDASDDNAATSSEAQAFKRACIGFGLGRYLYDLPSFEAPYKYGKFTIKPTLPDWAIPTVYCEQCTNKVTAIEHNGTTYAAGWVATNGRNKYGKTLCATCQKELAGKK